MSGGLSMKVIEYDGNSSNMEEKGVAWTEMNDLNPMQLGSQPVVTQV